MTIFRSNSILLIREFQLHFDSILVIYLSPSFWTPYFFIMNINDYDIDSYCEGAIKLDGLDDAIVGIVEDFHGPRILYSQRKILSILQERDLMTFGEAEEFYDFNIKGLYAGEQNPVFLITISE